jgi:hypothetical protein
MRWGNGSIYKVFNDAYHLWTFCSVESDKMIRWLTDSVYRGHSSEDEVGETVYMTSVLCGCETWSLLQGKSIE